MKKIGLLLLALVVALGALGVGYAMWSDTIYVDGTVNTGNVDINVTDYSGTWVYKDVPNHTAYSFTGDYDDNPYKDLGYTLISSAVAAQTVEAEVAVDDSVTMTYDNLFPGYNFCADFSGVYAGSIPVHIYAEIESDDAWLEALWDANYVTVVITIEEETYTGGVVQLHEGDEFNVALCIEIPQEDVELEALLSDYGIEADGAGTTQDWLENQSGTFTASIVAYQWNETYPAP